MKKKRKTKGAGVKVTVNIKPPITLGKLLKTPVSKRAAKYPNLGVRDNEIEQTALALQTK